MSKSILDTRKGICFLCGQHDFTEVHHIFGGPNRRISDDMREHYGETKNRAPRGVQKIQDGIA